MLVKRLESWFIFNSSLLSKRNLLDATYAGFVALDHLSPVVPPAPLPTEVHFAHFHRLVDRVVKASTSRAAGLSLIPALAVDVFFFWSSHTSDLKTGALAPTLPDVGTVWPGVSILSLGEIV